MGDDITAKLAAAKLDMLIKDAQRENVDREEWRILARLSAETSRTDPWTAASNLFGGRNA